MSDLLQLHHISQWHEGLDCSHTALCAATGFLVDKVERAIEAAARDKGKGVGDKASTAPADWADGLKKLGFMWDIIHTPSDGRPTINEFMKANASPYLLLVIAVEDATQTGHVSRKAVR